MPDIINLFLALTAVFNFPTSALPSAQNSQQAISPTQLHHEQSIIRPETPTIRNATPADLPSIAKTFDDAFKPSPIWKYINQFVDQYPHYHKRCLLETVTQIIQKTTQDGNGVIKVIAVPNEDSDGHAHGETVVSVAFWHFIDETTADSDTDSPMLNQHTGIPGHNIWLHSESSHPESGTTTAISTEPDQPPFNCTLHLDANITRLDSILSQESATIAHYLSPAYPTRLYLALLATHPDHDGHGYAAAQVELGLTWAAQRGLPVTLLATPAGYPVYKGLGFENVKNVTVEFLDGLGGDWEEVMVWTGRERRQDGEDGGRV